MFKREWVNAGAAVVAAMAAVGLLVVGMVSLAAGFTADVQASIDAVRTEMRASIEAAKTENRALIEAAKAENRALIEAAQAENRALVEAAQAENRALVEAAQAENRALIEAAQVENRAAHAELGRKIESGGERIDRMYELLLAQANP